MRGTGSPSWPLTAMSCGSVGVRHGAGGGRDARRDSSPSSMADARARDAEVGWGAVAGVIGGGSFVLLAPRVSFEGALIPTESRLSISCLST